MCPNGRGSAHLTATLDRRRANTNDSHGAAYSTHHVIRTKHILQVPTDDLDSIFDVDNISDGDLYLGTEGVSRNEEVMMVSRTGDNIFAISLIIPLAFLF